MKKMLMGLFALGVGVAGVAHAGQKWPIIENNVVINQTARSAYGWVSSARNSPNGNERISCVVSGSTGGYRSASCTFQDAKGTYAACSSSNPDIVNAIQFMQSDSYLWAYWDASGACQSVSMYSDSANMPKAP